MSISSRVFQGSGLRFLRLCFRVGPAENTGAVFTHQAIEREIKDQQHCEKYQDFHGPALGRVLH
jgi:hypothetical protein